MPKNYYVESYQKNSKNFMDFLNKEITENTEEQKKKFKEYQDLIVQYIGYTPQMIKDKSKEKKKSLKISECELRDKVKDYNEFITGLSEKKV